MWMGKMAKLILQPSLSILARHVLQLNEYPILIPLNISIEHGRCESTRVPILKKNENDQQDPHYWYTRFSLGNLNWGEKTMDGKVAKNSLWKEWVQEQP